MGQMRLFSVDEEGVKDVVRDLVEALDVYGFDGPLELWDGETGPLWAACRQLEHLEADDGWRGVQQQLQQLEKQVRAAAGPDLTDRLRCMRMAAAELKQCLTWEDRR